MCSVSVPCPLCAQTNFPNIDSLRISLIKAANGPLTCPICRDTLLGLDKLTIHLFSHTNLIGEGSSTASSANSVGVKIEKSSSEEGYLNCVTTYSQCPDESPPKSAALSDLFANQPKCETCGLMFRSDDLLNMHNKLIHQIQEPTPTVAGDARYQCHLCAKVFKMKGSLRVHLKVVHFLGLPGAQSIPKLSICDQTKQQNIGSCGQIIITSPAVAANNMQVLVVPQTFPTNLGTDEVTTPTSEEVDLIVNQDRKPPSESGKGSESTKIWECDICSKSFTTKYFLKKHKRLHTGEMPYTCEICGKTFTFQQSYHKHLLYHSDEKPHICQICGRAFKELSTLHNHERIHSGEKPFKCEICGKCFRQRVSYLVHKRIHTGVMPYKCNACQKSFRYKVSQRTHKCTAQSAEASSEVILQKLLHSTSILQDENCDIPHNANQLIPSSGSAGTGSKEKLSEELLAKSIDDIVAESCNKMGIGSNDGVESPFCVNNSDGERMPSPSEGFQNLCLYSPSNEPVTAHLEVINEDSLKQFLYEVNKHL